MRFRHELALAALVAILGAPFLNKAYNVDDTLMLRVAENVMINSSEPFVGELDYVGRIMPIWNLATNPPLISYFVAPIARGSNFSEVAVHVGVMLFPVLLALGVFSLAGRFCSGRWWPTLFSMTSAGVLVSPNVMQDVPATALVTAGVAVFITGCDHDDRRRLFAGSLLAGLAVVTKYSAVIVFPLLLIYALLQSRPRHAPWALVSLLPFAFWSLHNLQIHGELHVLQVAGRSYGPGVAWRRNLVGVSAVVGSLLYLAPVVSARAIAIHDRVVVVIALVVTLGVGVGASVFLQTTDPQHIFWTIAGTLLLGVCVSDGSRRMLRRSAGGPRSDARDSAFLLAWLSAPILFSVIFPPFQAVRHLLPALPPLILLSFRYLHPDAGRREPRMGFALGSLLFVQTAIALLVARADADQAGVYRDFAGSLDEISPPPSGETWFVGHWGWQFYAQRAGIRQLHGRGSSRPAEGDLLVWPDEVLRGPFHREPEDLGLRLREVDRVVYPSRLPVRTQGIRHGAGFYALAARPPNVPYRFFESAPLETFRIFEVLGNQPEARRP